jgi:hypothetical protein
LLVGEGVNLQPLEKSKTKGQTIKPSEQRVLKLGAKGPKKNNRTCSTCGLQAGHDSLTCLLLPHNKERLAQLGTKKRGRPPGAKNKVESDAMGNIAGSQEINKKEIMEPRRRGRPPGSKNRMHPQLIAASGEECESPYMMDG